MFHLYLHSPSHCAHYTYRRHAVSLHLPIFATAVLMQCSFPISDACHELYKSYCLTWWGFQDLPVGPGYPFVSGSSPVTCGHATLAVTTIWWSNPHHCVQAEIPWGTWIHTCRHINTAITQTRKRRHIQIYDSSVRCGVPCIILLNRTLVCRGIFYWTKLWCAVGYPM
jgi:hypothetical protein